MLLVSLSPGHGRVPRRSRSLRWLLLCMGPQFGWWQKINQNTTRVVPLEIDIARVFFIFVYFCLLLLLLLLLCVCFCLSILICWFLSVFLLCFFFFFLFSKCVFFFLNSCFLLYNFRVFEFVCFARQ
jgi:hypothetical protein